VPRDVPADFGEALFLHLDEMAAATTEGFTQARLHAAGEPQQRTGGIFWTGVQL
jgi:hypothetical protein